MQNINALLLLWTKVKKFRNSKECYMSQLAVAGRWLGGTGLKQI